MFLFFLSQAKAQDKSLTDAKAKKEAPEQEAPAAMSESVAPSMVESGSVVLVNTKKTDSGAKSAPAATQKEEEEEEDEEGDEEEDEEEEEAGDKVSHF